MNGEITIAKGNHWSHLQNQARNWWIKGNSITRVCPLLIIRFLGWWCGWHLRRLPPTYSWLNSFKCTLIAEFVGVWVVKNLINDCIMLSVIASNNSKLSVLYSAAIILKSITFFIIIDHQMQSLMQQESKFLHCMMLSLDHQTGTPTSSTKSGCLDFLHDSETRQYPSSLLVD